MKVGRRTRFKLEVKAPTTKREYGAPRFAARTFSHIQQRDGRWCIVDLVGKQRRIGTIPMVLKAHAEAVDVLGIAPHDLRRTCVKQCRAAGGELEQIQLLLGHVSV